MNFHYCRELFFHAFSRNKWHYKSEIYARSRGKLKIQDQEKVPSNSEKISHT